MAAEANTQSNVTSPTQQRIRLPDGNWYFSIRDTDQSHDPGRPVARFMSELGVFVDIKLEEGNLDGQRVGLGPGSAVYWGLCLLNFLISDKLQSLRNDTYQLHQNIVGHTKEIAGDVDEVLWHQLAQLELRMDRCYEDRQRMGELQLKHKLQARVIETALERLRDSFAIAN